MKNINVTIQIKKIHVGTKKTTRFLIIFFYFEIISMLLIKTSETKFNSGNTSDKKHNFFNTLLRLVSNLANFSLI